MASRTTVTVCFVLLGLLGAGVASAEQPKPASAVSKADLDRLKQALDTGNEAEKIAALDELGRFTGPSAAPAAQRVSELLQRGASVAVLTRALEVAGKLRQTSSSAAVVPYTRHRIPELRSAATRTLASTGGPDAIVALRALLHGGDRPARGLAASGLATLNAKDAVPDLFAVLGKDVPEAAGAIGELCVTADCGKFAEFLGKMPFDLMQTGLSPILLRPETEVSAEFKLELLERLRKLQTDEAKSFLETIRSSYPEKGNAWVKYALEQAVNNKPVVLPPAGKAKGKP